MPHTIGVTTANVTDREGALLTIHAHRSNWSAVEVVLGKRSELHTFKVIPKRWVVERSFGWIEKCQKTLEKLRASTQYLSAFR